MKKTVTRGCRLQSAAKKLISSYKTFRGIHFLIIEQAKAEAAMAADAHHFIYLQFNLNFVRGVSTSRISHGACGSTGGGVVRIFLGVCKN
jgi:hypothetical protein